MKLPTLRTERRGNEWWITGLHPDHGPYDTRREADQSRRGMLRTMREMIRMGIDPDPPPPARTAEPGEPADGPPTQEPAQC